MVIINYDNKYKQDIPNLFTNTIHKTCNKDYTKEQLNAWANPNIDYDSWEKRLDKTKPYLAVIDDIIVGFTEFYDDYIDCFYIHDAYQGQGVGKALMTYIINETREKNIKTIRVNASITAKSFFESFGFVQIKKNSVERNNQVLVNYSLELEVNN